MSDPTLPGLEVPAPKPGDLVKAVHTTLDALRDREVIDDQVDAARSELALSLARIIEAKERTGRTSTVGNDARVLMDLLDNTVPEGGGGGGVDEQLRAALDELEAAALEKAREEDQRAASPADAGTEVRDPA